MADRAEKEWLELLADLMASPLAGLPVEPLAQQLIRTFDALACAYSAARAARVGGSLEPLLVDVVEWTAPRAGGAAIRRAHPLVPVHPSLRSRRAPGRTAPARAVAAWNCRHQLGMPLAADGHRAFVLGRDGEFADHEIDLAARIRRLVVGLDQQVRAFAAGAPGTSKARITPREQAVLGELARGVTAAVISRRLGISERTVHKHLEHIYGKLEVTDRLSAVLRAKDAGLIAG